jgi:hypothetical protein
MAYRVSNGAGTAFNTAANWDEGVNSPTVHASTSITVTSGGVTSATFTAPNTTNACTGALVPVAAVGTAGTITATLQEAGVDVVGATATINITALRASTLVFFEFATPYVFTATTAGRYRIKLNTTGASGTTSIAADSGGSNFAYLATMNSNVVPTTNDDVIIVSPNQGSELAVSLDTSPSIGSGTNTSVAVFRSWGNALTFANNGVLSWPTGTSRTVTCKGNILIESAGELRMGSTSAKIAAGTLARLTFDQNGVTTNYGISHLTGGKFILQGTSKTFNKTTLSSGVGSTASPIVTADSVDWAVGDELVSVPVSNNAANYDEMETRFIRVKNSATSYTLAATSGGAESAFSNSHANGLIINLTRSVLIDTTDNTKAWYADFNETTAIANVDLDGCRLETIGSGVASRTTITFSNLAAELFTADDVVFYRLAGTQGITFGNNNDLRTYTWLVFYDCNATGQAGALFLSSLRNKTFENCYVVDSQSGGFFANAASSCEFENCHAYACGRASATTQGGWQFTNSSNMFLNTCGAQACRSYGVTMATMAGLTGIDCEFGNKGYNGSADIQCTSDQYNTALFDNSLFGSTTLISNYTNMTDGAEIAFNKFNQTDNDHRWYTKYGSARSTGASLADTTVRTADSLALRIAPEDSTTGFEWTFKVLARANSAVSISGFIKKNAAFSTDDVDVELYLPGLTPGVDTPSDSMTMPDDTSWNVFALAANYVGSVDLYATVRVVAKTTTSLAYIYVDDLFNGTNPVTAIDVWADGKPSDIMFEQLGDAAAVWSVLTSTLTTSGTVGYLMTKLLTVAKFLGLR